MSNKDFVHPLNAKGNYYCTSPEFDNGCIQCGLCPGNLPEVFAEDDEGSAYVHQQPTEDLISLVEELILDCPVEKHWSQGTS